VARQAARHAQKPPAGSRPGAVPAAGRAGIPSAGARGRVRPAESRGRPARADPVRRAVLDVLLAVASRDAYANLLLPSVLRERRIAGRDAALATELCYGTLRSQGTYDAILSVCSDRRVNKMDPPVREALRLGVHQLLATRIAAHAAVATSVDLAKDIAGPRPGGFVNAVLRRVATRNLDEWIAVVAPDRAADPQDHLAVRHGYPGWIVGAFRDALGEAPGQTLAEAADPAEKAAQAAILAETEAALAAGNVAPRVTLCALPGRCDPGELAASPGCEPARLSPFGAYLTRGDPAAVRAVSEHRATVQDEASQLAALALARAELTGPDGRWLDMCAGPGGKAGLLAGLAAGRGARLVASDVRPHRASMAWDAIAGPAPAAGHGTAAGTAPAASTGTAAGTGTAASTGTADGTAHAVAALVADGTAPAWRQGAFDRVLADVPCSGLGSLRRRPESRWRRSAGQVTELARLQRALLGAAVDSARPGGVIGYVTCSPHLAETREVVAGLLRDRQDVEVLDAPALLPEVAGLGCAEPFGKFAQFWPHRHGTDAIFLAVIRRLA
jgi:16S rRNA (cytosine967-C5)-methyltransferase